MRTPGEECNGKLNRTIKWLIDSVNKINNSDCACSECAEQFTTDESLYLDPIIKELRSNIGDSEQRFVWTSGVQEFILNEEPSSSVQVYVNGQKIDWVTQFMIDVPNKKLTILDTLDVNDIIHITYKFIITP